MLNILPYCSFRATPTTYNIQHISIYDLRNPEKEKNSIAMVQKYKTATVLVLAILVPVPLYSNNAFNHVVVSAFSMPMFTQHRAMQRTTPSKTEGVEIELPDFDELFGRIKEVSPLAAMAIDGKEGGFAIADQMCKYFHTFQ